MVTGDDDVVNRQELEIERIDNTRVFGGRRQYYIKWKGYGADENTWEDREELIPNAKDLLIAFEVSKGLVAPKAPRRSKRRRVT